MPYPNRGRAVWFPLAAFAFVVIVIGMIGCGRAARENQLERQLEASLPDIIGPADSYQVHLEGVSPTGHIDSAEIHGYGVETRDGLHIDDFNLTLDDVRVDIRRSEIRDVGRTRARIRLSEDSVNQYLRERRPEIRDLGVHFANGLVELHARPQILGISGDIDLRGNFRANRNSRLDFIPEHLAIAGLPIPGILTRFIGDRVNPILDLSGLEVPVSIDRIDARSGSIQITGGAQIHNLPLEKLRRRH